MHAGQDEPSSAAGQAPVADWLADHLSRAGRAGAGGAEDQHRAAQGQHGAAAAPEEYRPARDRLSELLHQCGAIDRAVYQAIASVPAPALDRAMRQLSAAADHSRLWLGIAAVAAATGGRAGRRAAARGVLAIGVTSAVVNLGIKSVSARQRPDRAGAGVPAVRHVAMPSSTSFPSGHSACAFAFATAVSRDSPWLAVAIQFLAGAVAYSRVHTGVHYPGDTVAGALIGAGAGQAVSSLLDRALASQASPAARP